VTATIQTYLPNVPKQTAWLSRQITRNLRLRKVQELPANPIINTIVSWNRHPAALTLKTPTSYVYGVAVTRFLFISLIWKQTPNTSLSASPRCSSSNPTHDITRTHFHIKDLSTFATTLEEVSTPTNFIITLDLTP
jgi:hypothetical protein